VTDRSTVTDAHSLTAVVSAGRSWSVPIAAAAGRDLAIYQDVRGHVPMAAWSSATPTARIDCLVRVYNVPVMFPGTTTRPLCSLPPSFDGTFALPLPHGRSFRRGGALGLAT